MIKNILDRIERDKELEICIELTKGPLIEKIKKLEKENKELNKLLNKYRKYIKWPEKDLKE